MDNFSIEKVLKYIDFQYFYIFVMGVNAMFPNMYKYNMPGYLQV